MPTEADARAHASADATARAVLMSRALSGVAKINRHGKVRGTSLVSTDEIEAMAWVIANAILVPPKGAADEDGAATAMPDAGEAAT